MRRNRPRGTVAGTIAPLVTVSVAPSVAPASPDGGGTEHDSRRTVRAHVRPLGGVRVLCLLTLALCAGISSCSSPAPTVSSQASTSVSAQQPATPDPCTLLGNAALFSVYTPISAATHLEMIEWTHQGDYEASIDETGASRYCTWSAPRTTDLGAIVSLSVVQIFLRPASQYTNETCDTEVDGIGETACVNNLGGLDVKQGFFELDVLDDTAQPPHLDVEKQLANYALVALHEDVPGQP